jgi:hypothetical protein
MVDVMLNWVGNAIQLRPLFAAMTLNPKDEEDNLRSYVL